MEYSITLYKDFKDLDLRYTNFLLVGLPAPCNVISGIYYILYYTFYAFTFYIKETPRSRAM